MSHIELIMASVASVASLPDAALVTAVAAAAAVGATAAAIYARKKMPTTRLVEFEDSGNIMAVSVAAQPVVPMEEDDAKVVTRPVRIRKPVMFKGAGDDGKEQVP